MMAFVCVSSIRYITYLYLASFHSTIIITIYRYFYFPYINHSTCFPYHPHIHITNHIRLSINVIIGTIRMLLFIYFLFVLFNSHSSIKINISISSTPSCIYDIECTVYLYTYRIYLLLKIFFYFNSIFECLEHVCQTLFNIICFMHR